MLSVNSTEFVGEATRDPVFGLISTIFCVLFYGSAFTPMKIYDGGDGVFVQWMMSCGQMLPAFILAWKNAFPPIYPIAMLGGVAYSIANCFTVPIMTKLGMTLAPLLWNATTCLVGWAVGRFGLFGVPQMESLIPWLNTTGLVAVIVGGAICTTVKSRSSPLLRSNFTSHSKVFEQDQVENRTKSLLRSPSEDEAESGCSSTRIAATITALLLGLIYGNLLTPISALVAHSQEWNVPNTVEPYLFSHFLGAFLTSTLLFIFYGMARKNEPQINPSICLPAMLSGGLFGTGEVLFFVANHHLSQVIAFPIITSMPGLINSLWGIFLFKEIQGRSNICRLGIAYLITCSGVLMITLSRFDF
ncbi:unnamed protein product, partial [Mesorhabditis belari]|uniref:Transmembrane protein 144 n=1 Tax=Mesorhabditis belari TaxID=2138241 RepID=A0AAF3EQP6_9BILA